MQTGKPDVTSFSPCSVSSCLHWFFAQFPSEICPHRVSSFVLLEAAVMTAVPSLLCFLRNRRYHCHRKQLAKTSMDA